MSCQRLTTPTDISWNQEKDSDKTLAGMALKCGDGMNRGMENRELGGRCTKVMPVTSIWSFGCDETAQIIFFDTMSKESR